MYRTSYEDNRGVSQNFTIFEQKIAWQQGASDFIWIMPIFGWLQSGTLLHVNERWLSFFEPF
jgi:hypothetical protein